MHGTYFANCLNHMEKRIIGIVLTILGIAGLIYAAVAFVQGRTNTHDIKLTIISLILGLIFFGSGIGLIRNTNDKAS